MKTFKEIVAEASKTITELIGEREDKTIDPNDPNDPNNLYDDPNYPNDPAADL